MARDQDSARIELEVTTVILGILLVMVSILTTMPSDTLDILKKMVVHSTYSPLEGPPTTIVTITPASVTISQLILYSLLSLLITIPLYLLYLGSREKVVLIFARTSLLLSAVFSIPLLMMFCGLLMFRLVGQEAIALINPSLEIVANACNIIAFLWGAALWYRGRASWLPIVKRFNKLLHRTKSSEQR